MHPFYQERFGCRRGDLPAAEALYEQILSLPLYPRMTEVDVQDVIDAVVDVLGTCRR
jgi:perosamine synthetase